MLHPGRPGCMRWGGPDPGGERRSENVSLQTKGIFLQFLLYSYNLQTSLVGLGGSDGVEAVEPLSLRNMFMLKKQKHTEHMDHSLGDVERRKYSLNEKIEGFMMLCDKCLNASFVIVSCNISTKFHSNIWQFKAPRVRVCS